jgi:hypothetical protein
VGTRQHGQGLADLMYDPFKPFHDVLIREAKNRVARVAHYRITIPIVLKTQVMTEAINLDDQLLLATEKIDKVRPYRHLPTELAMANLSFGDVRPKSPLRRTDLTAKSFGAFGVPWPEAWIAHPQPLPQAGGEIKVDRSQAQP